MTEAEPVADFEDKSVSTTASIAGFDIVLSDGMTLAVALDEYSLRGIWYIHL